MERSELFIKEKILGVKTKAQRSVIIGTDWWSDCDDVVAMHILSWAHKEGLINILGVGINACMEYSAASLCAYLESRGLFGIPIGIDADATDFTGIAVYQKRMVPYSSGIKSNFQAEEPVKMYRRLLASSKDGAVEIIEIGFSQVLASLLESGADEYSHLSGMELVAAKVKKLWIMAGKWDEQGGMEHNFNNNARASAAAEK